MGVAMKNQGSSLMMLVVIACLLMTSSPGCGVALAQTQTDISNSLNSLVQESNLLYNALSAMVSSAQADAAANQAARDAAADMKRNAKDKQIQAKEDKLARDTVDRNFLPIVARVDVLAPSSRSFVQALGRAAASHDPKTYGAIVINSRAILAQMKDIHAGLDRLKGAAKGAPVTNASLKQLFAMKDSLHSVVQRVAGAKNSWPGN